jgi:deoxyuridine 5'-triphosphate nucleotidohydrolase
MSIININYIDSIYNGEFDIKFIHNIGESPVLYINEEQYYGINILEKVNELFNDSLNLPINIKEQIKKLYIKVSLYHQSSILPTLKYKLYDERSIVPFKNISDAGYDITIIDIFKKISENTILYETGVSLEIPLGYMIDLRPRSSISKTGYILTNSPGTIDPGYTGTLKVALTRVDFTLPEIKLPIRIAQIILIPCVNSNLIEMGETIETSRGDGGFGSTDKIIL